MKSIFTISAVFISAITAYAQCPASAVISSSTKCIIITYPAEPAAIYDSLDYLDSPPARYWYDSKDAPGTVPFTVTYRDGTPGGCGGTVSVSDTIVFYKTVALSLVSDTCVYAAGALPLTLLKFSGNGYSGVNEIKWTVANVHNVSKFSIEKMRINSTSFETVYECDFIKGSLEYTFLDRNEIIHKSLYRLKIVDFDGTTSYSHTLSINNNKSAQQAAISAYPNPCSEQITIKINDEGGLNNRLIIKDLTGRNVREMQVLDNYSTTISLADLSNGIYFIHYGSEVMKFEKN